MTVEILYGRRCNVNKGSYQLAIINNKLVERFQYDFSDNWIDCQGLTQKTLEWIWANADFVHLRAFKD